MIAIAREGETLDALLWRTLGRYDISAVVLAANPHLATLPAQLPAGVRVTIPPLPAPPERPVARLWG
ncbi:MAG: tail protein X [Rhodocyclaceae bacterium]|nr:tail protein X [Rhodocyclaceae bacterium]